MIVEGFLIVDKPLGLSSAAALNQVKRLLPRGTKLGHAGTLDPLATGVLVALVGRATKMSDRVMGQPKQYEALIRLGATSLTDDAEGPITPTIGAPPAIGAPPVTGAPPTNFSREQIEVVLQRFVGTISQMPPAFSALKIAGRRACDRMRDGQTVELKPRDVRIDRIELLDTTGADKSVAADLRIRIDCGKGTYVRSLARDIGEALGCGGYLAGLIRTRVGPFRIELAATPEQLARDGVEKHLKPVAFVDQA